VVRSAGAALRPAPFTAMVKISARARNTKNRHCQERVEALNHGGRTRLGCGLGRRGWRSLHVLLCRHDQRGEPLGIPHGHVRQNLPVEINPAGLQAVDQLAVGGAVGPRGGADALDPQRAVITLTRPAVAIGVTQRTVHPFLRGAEELALCEEESLGVSQQLLAAGAPFGTAFYSWHGSGLLVRASRALPMVSGSLNLCDVKIKAVKPCVVQRGETNAARPPAPARGKQDGFVSLNCIAPRIFAGQPAGRHPLRSAWLGVKTKVRKEARDGYCARPPCSPEPC